jgi:hypothetical protein
MNTLDFFLLQFDSADARITARSLEMNLRCLKGVDGLNKQIDHMKRNFPERSKQFESDWFISMVEAITPFYEPMEDSTNDDYTNPFNEFMEQALCTLNNSSFALIGEIAPCVENFEASELDKPHMQWVKAFTRRYQQLQRDFPESKRAWLPLTRIHPSYNISDDLGIELLNEYISGDYVTGLYFMGYVNWYVRSRKHFLIENKTLEPELEARMASTTAAWLGDVSTSKNIRYWLSRNYEFHPKHEGFLDSFIRKQKANNVSQVPKTKA